MRLLLTGAAGLIGSVLAPRLRARGHEVVPFDRRIDSADDIRDASRTAEAVAGCDGVVHLAAVSRVAWGEADPETCRAVNEVGTGNLLEAIRRDGGRAFLALASSREVYGEFGTAAVTEDAPLRPVNAYGRSKAEAEGLVEAALAVGAARGAILRLSNVYGGRADHPDRAVPSLVWHALRGEQLRLTGGDTFFDFVHVEDVASAFETVIDRLGGGAPRVETVHLTTGVPVSLRRLARAAITRTGSTAPILEEAPRPFDVTGFTGDPAAAGRVLDWRAHVPLEKGLDRVAASLRADGPLPPAVPPPPWPPTRDGS